MKYVLLLLVGIVCFSGKVATAKTLTVVSTAYCSCKICTGKNPSHPAYGITASGKKVSHGTVAVDPKIIPLGSRFTIKGFRNTVFRAEDTGGAIKGRRIDLWFPSHGDALIHGRKKLTITILSKPPSKTKATKPS